MATPEDWRDFRSEFGKVAERAGGRRPMRAIYNPQGWKDHDPRQHWRLFGGHVGARRAFERLAGSAAAALDASDSHADLERWLDVLRASGSELNEDVTMSIPNDDLWSVETRSPSSTQMVMSVIDDVCQASMTTCTLMATKTPAPLANGAIDESQTEQPIGPIDADGKLIRGHFSVAEVARHLKISEKTIRRAIETGELPATKFGRILRIHGKDIADYKRRHPAKK
jgi:excisionase family DNA binding protein